METSRHHRIHWWLLVPSLPLPPPATCQSAPRPAVKTAAKRRETVKETKKEEAITLHLRLLRLEVTLPLVGSKSIWTKKKLI
mmetsp:Transcript_105396/g.304901  ORF Transcript_105396/g.304901 Transcript_105396/m.304901 type:complete len:82 (-) Transcript_105396:629-874(-)